MHPVAKQVQMRRADALKRWAAAWTTAAHRTSLNAALRAQEERRSGRRAAGGAVAVVALLAIVGVGAAGALRTTPGADRTAASIAVFPLLALLGAAAAAAAITTVLARRRLMPDPEDDDDDEEADAARSRWLRLALLLLPLAVAGALIFAIAVRPTERTPSQQPVEAPRPFPLADSAGGERDPWKLVALAGGAVAMTAVMGYGMWKVRPRRRRGLAARRPPAPDAAVAVDDALAALDAERDPRRAIINAYVRMERALDDAGLGRRDSEAPREYLGRVAGALRGDERAARRLTALYEEARFSAHAVDEAMRAEAVAALRALRAEGAA
jgi:hypothetical protein